MVKFYTEKYKLLIIILWFVVSCERYDLYGKVENVAYSTSREWPCYIALSTSPKDFHASRNVNMCGFAERAHSLNKDVHLIGQFDTGSNVAVVLLWDKTDATFNINPSLVIVDKGPFWTSSKAYKCSVKKNTVFINLYQFDDYPNKFLTPPQDWLNNNGYVLCKSGDCNGFLDLIIINNLQG